MNDNTHIDMPPQAKNIRRLALLVEYNGFRYHGFQAQGNAISVQETIEDSIFSFTGERTRIKGAGRTDTGVHAKGQVISFDTTTHYAPEVFEHALNQRLPKDISIKEVTETRSSFDPRRDAISRSYQYQILNTSTRSPLFEGYSYHVKTPLDINRMNLAAQSLEGLRDFKPFSGPLPDTAFPTTRNMFKCVVVKNDETVILTLRANSFLPQQVRRITGALVQVGLHKMTLPAFLELTDCNVLGASNWVLPGKALCLLDVEYPISLFSYPTMNVWEQAIREVIAI